MDGGVGEAEKKGLRPGMALKLLTQPPKHPRPRARHLLNPRWAKIPSPLAKPELIMVDVHVYD